MPSFRTKGFLTVFGAFLLHINLATIHTWPSLTRYFYSYLIELNEESFPPSYLDITFSLVNAVHSVFIPIGVYLSFKYNITTILGTGWIMMLLAKFTFYFYPHYIVITVALCTCSSGSGLCYMPAWISAWKYFPHRKGFITGLIWSGFGWNRWMFKYISVDMINHNKVAPLPGRERYSPEINDSFKIYLEKSVIFFSILSFLSLLFIYPVETKDYNINTSKMSRLSKQNNISSTSLINIDINLRDSELSYYDNSIDFQNDAKEGGNIFALVISYPFLQLTFILFLTMIFGSVEWASTKKLGWMHGHDENFLWYCSWLWKWVNAIFFSIWGTLLDKFKFRNIYMFIIIAQIGITAFCYFTSKYKVGYVIFNLWSACVNSGSITASVTCFPYIFGINNGALLFGLASILINTFYIFRPLINNWVTSVFYFHIFYWSISLCSLVALIILCFFVEKNMIINRIIRRKRRWFLLNNYII